MADGTRSSRWRAFWARGGFWRALLMVAVYLALYLGAGKLVGALWGGPSGPADLLRSPENVFFDITAAIVVGIVLLVVLAGSLGWLGPLLGRQPALPRHWWMWIPPVVVVAFNVLRFAAVDYARYTAGTVVMVLVTGLCVGVAEELLTRGLAVRLLRLAGYRELAVAASSSLLFAAAHGVNIFSGQAPLVVGLTMLYTFFFGVAMYLTLRVTRSLVWPMLLHASTDPAGLLLSGGIDAGGGAGQHSVVAAVAANANNVVIVVGLVTIWFIRGRVTAPGAAAPDPASRDRGPRSSAS